MERRELGRASIEVTVVGLGGAPIGRGSTERVTALRTVWAALEAGINLIDTSPHYGLGRSELLIGQALRERPDLAAGCHISTKTGHYQGTKNHTYDATRRSVALSLERLRQGYLDIVHLHDLHTTEEWWRAMRPLGGHRALRELKEQGVIGAIGVGTRALDVLELAVDSEAYDVLMIANQYDLLNQAGARVIARARDKGIGVLIAGAYATGILAKGSADPAARYRYREPSREIREQVASIEALCEKWGCTLPGAAVRFCLRGPASQAAMVLGARTPEQVRGNVRVAREAIPAGFWDDLEAMMEGRSRG